MGRTWTGYESADILAQQILCSGGKAANMMPVLINALDCHAGLLAR